MNAVVYPLNITFNQCSKPLSILNTSSLIMKIPLQAVRLNQKRQNLMKTATITN